MSNNQKNIFRIMEPERLQNSEADPRSRQIFFPQRILWTQGEVTNQEALLEKRSLQISLSKHNACIMKSVKGQKASVLLDYGIEIHGSVRILAWSDSTNRGSKVRVRFGESASEAMSEIGEYGATNDHARRDILTEVGMMSMNEIGESGFRFVRIDLEEEEAVLALKSICAVLIYKDAEYRGSFRCNDELLNKIWNVGAYTVHLNMQEYIWDGIKRDRLVWIGDMHPESLTVRSVFGADSSIEKSLDFIREETPLPGWMNHMAPYTMWYCIILYDWYLYTGHLDFIRKQADYLAGVRQQLTESIGSDGMDTVTEGRFLDWPSSDRPKVVDAGVQAIHILAEESLLKLFELLGDEKNVSQCREDLARLRSVKVDYQNSKQAAALSVLSGLKEAQAVYQDILSRNGAHGMSTFMGYYILKAMGMAGAYENCCQVIRDYWGGMLSVGATTFWEDFDIDWLENAGRIDELPVEGKVDIHRTYGGYCYSGLRHSFCHGWASGVTPWMSENILGIQILEAGCRKIKVEPHLGDLEWAEGTYPTPMGDLYVSHRKGEDGVIETKIQAPEGVEIVS